MSAPHDSSLTTLDMTRLDEIFDDDRETIAAILTECSTFVAEKITSLKEAFEVNNLEQILQDAHAIRGSCANVGASTCERAADIIEELAREKRVELESLRTLETAYKSLKQAVEKYIGEKV